MKKEQIFILLLILIFIFINPKKAEIPKGMLEETEEFDYNNENIQSVISNFRGNQMERLRNTLDFIDNNIKYDSEVTVQACYEETASSVLKARSGDCVSMSRLAVAMLRGQGIKARTTGGCVKERYTCSSLMALWQPVYRLPPRIKDITDIKKRGYLHEWIEVFVDNTMYIADPTSNTIFPMNCNDYNIYKYDTNPYERCVIVDKKFVQECYHW